MKKRPGRVKEIVNAIQPMNAKLILKLQSVAIWNKFFGLEWESEG
jgi:hypothetical protein